MRAVSSDSARASFYTQSITQPEVLRMFARLRLTAVALVLSVVASACGSDSTSPLEQPPGATGTLADAMAQFSIPALDAVASMTGVPGTSTSWLSLSSCAYSAAAQSFTCPPITTSGVTVTQSYTLLDASGAKQPAYGATTTSAVRQSSSITGTIKQGAVDVAVDAHQELTLSGLLTSTRVIDGLSTVKLTGTGTTLPAPISTLVTTTIDKLVLPAKAIGGDPAWPTSGTITVETKPFTSGVAAAATVTVKITFTGSSRATVTVTAANFSQTCTVDLSSHAPNCS
jgi:hypothetical protein